MGITLAILLGNLCCTPRQPLFNLKLPERLNIIDGKAILIKDGPNSGVLVFPNGIVHLGPNPKKSFQLDTASYYKWGIIKEPKLLGKNDLLIFVSTPRNSGDPFMPIYDLDSIRIDFKNLTLYEYGSRSSSYIIVDTIDYSFPTSSVLLYKKLLKNGQGNNQQISK